MKSKIQVTLRMLAFAAMVLFISTCSNDIAKSYVGATGADLLAITIGEGEAAVSFTAEELPAAVDHTLYGFSSYDLYSQMDFKWITFMRESEVTDVRIRPTISPRAWAEWGIGSRSAGPDVFYPAGIPATFSTEDYLYIKVQSESGENTKYYRFYAQVFSSVTHLAALSIDGIKATVETGGSKWDNAKEGAISIRSPQAAAAEIECETFDANATVKFAKVLEANAATEPVFEASNKLSFVDQDLLYAQVTAHNTIDTAVYKFRVSVGRIATIKTLVLADTETGPTKKDVEIVGKGSPNSTWGSTLAGAVETAKVDPVIYKIAVELDDPLATYEFGKMATSTSRQDSVTWLSNPNDEITFELDNALGVRVRSENGKGSMFYKIKVDLLAAEFEVQPLSAAYYYYDANTKVGAGTAFELDWYDYVSLKVANPSDPKFANVVQPLGFTLDRALPGATYQWYEADSWYGGYGFDKDGRIAYKWVDPETRNTVEKEEPGFTVDTYHVKGLDEKGNVSLHNGGNQFYRLENPGRVIPGANAATYTPEINKRPFLAGFTSESHYYWVVITDPVTQRKVTSRRAVIVSERDPTKAHYIVNLNAYLDKTGNTNGLQLSPKNPSPFTAGNHGDKYAIPMKFPANFSIMDYSVVTCQTLFFLADGRPWIQNWTQGDFGFEDADGARLVLWYNVTNDNATRGLNGTGNDPVGGGLTATPGKVIIQPAGTKAMDRLPPFESDGVTPKNDGDAQGWFTPYIEICELRFEGPGRD